MSRRKSEAYRRISGTLRADRRRPSPESVGIPTAPATLLDDERRRWDELVRLLAPRCTLTLGDGLMLEWTARAGAEYDRAQTEMQRDGLTIRTARGSLRAHPAATIADRAWTRFVAGLRELAATPRTRASVDPAPQSEPATAADPLERPRPRAQQGPLPRSRWEGILP